MRENKKVAVMIEDGFEEFLELTKKIYDLHIKGFDGLEFTFEHEKDFDIIHSENIKDIYSNFISNFDVSSSNELEKIVKRAYKKMEKLNRKTVIYLIPYMQNLYSNKEKFFDLDYYEKSEVEVWQIFTDFARLDEIKTNCKLDVNLEIVKDMKQYANTLVECYQSGEEDDPYGNLDDGYKKSFEYIKKYDDIGTEFYFIKVNGEIIGTTESVYNKELFGIYSLAIKEEYRKMGIGKEVLKQQLRMCREKQIKTAFLQTEKGFYPHKMYEKFGFKDLCDVYYYSYKK